MYKYTSELRADELDTNVIFFECVNCRYLVIRCYEIKV
jgi:hypothetical protein